MAVNGAANITAVILEGRQTPATGTTLGSVEAGGGTPVHDGTQVLFTTSIGRIEPAEATTVGGRVTVKLFGDGRSGVAKVTAYSGSATSTLDVDIGAAGATRIAVTANPQSLPPTGGTAVISARVEDMQGNGIGGVPVSFSTTKGNLSATVSVSNDLGVAQTSLTTVAEATVTASAGGSATALTGTVLVTLKPAATVTLTPPTSAALGVPASFAVTPGTGTFVSNVTLDFGDGSGVVDMGRVTAAQAATHFFRRSGELTVTARVTDGEGMVTSVSTRVAVTRFNGTITFTPAASATVPKMNDTVTFTVTSDTTGVSIDHIDWNFGDGQLLTTSGRSAAHPYGSTGLKTVTATVVAFGASESTPITVQVDIKP